MVGGIVGSAGPFVDFMLERILETIKRKGTLKDVPINVPIKDRVFIAISGHPGLNRVQLAEMLSVNVKSVGRALEDLGGVHLFRANVRSKCTAECACRLYLGTSSAARLHRGRRKSFSIGVCKEFICVESHSAFDRCDDGALAADEAAPDGRDACWPRGDSGARVLRKQGCGRLGACLVRGYFETYRGLF